MSQAAQARQLLRSAGFTARQVSARQDHSTLRVTVRSAEVSLAVVREVVAHLESIHRDHATGEVLCGVNAYLDVAYADEVLAPFVDKTRAALLSVELGFDVRIGFHVASRRAGAASWDVLVETVTRTEQGRHVFAHGVDHGAELIAIDNLSRGAYRGVLKVDHALNDETVTFSGS